MKRIQISVKPESMQKISEIVSKCNEDFLDGHVSSPDVVDWMIENSAFDIQKIRQRCLNPYKIKSNARLKYKSDIDALIKKLSLIRPLLEEEVARSNGVK
jgi:hypothetical protein